MLRLDIELEFNLVFVIVIIFGFEFKKYNMLFNRVRFFVKFFIL